ncbi:MAG: sulfatase-like hydrolase/transferase [Cyclobacteriaceae bacterium]|nr:sulfatase-like hydrolase/transferase [Cyclobacteriaceae bacterium]
MSSDYKLKIFLLLFSGLFYPGLFSEEVFGQPDRQPPNIIFMLTDDQRFDSLGFSGNQIIRTPNMDRLAADGIFFKNAFVTTPICAASRASIATGLYERTHQFTFSTPPLRKELVQSTYYWKYFRYIDYPGHEELYDLKNDPEEINNLISKDESSEMAGILREKCKNYGQYYLEKKNDFR